MKAHRTDGLSLTFGLVFLAVVAWWMAGAIYEVYLPNVGWFVAFAMIALGVLGLIGALRASRTPPPAEPVSPAEPASPAEPPV